MGEDDHLEQAYEDRFQSIVGEEDWDDGFGNGPMYTDCDECGELNCPIVQGVAETVCASCQ